MVPKRRGNIMLPVFSSIFGNLFDKQVAQDLIQQWQVITPELKKYGLDPKLILGSPVEVVILE